VRQKTATPAAQHEQKSLRFAQGSLWDTPEHSTASVVTEAFATPRYEMITEPAQLETLLPRILAAPVVAVDTETTGLDPLTDRLRLIQVATPHLTVVVDVQTCPAQALRPLFSQTHELLFHNAGFDLQFLTQAGLPWPTHIFDTMLMSQVLGAGKAEGNLSRCGLELVVKRYLGLSLPKEEQRSQWEGLLRSEQLAYAARDAAVLQPLAERLKEDLHTASLDRVAAIENRCVPALAWLESAGLPIDAERWLARAQGDEARVRALEQQLDTIVGQGETATNLLLNSAPTVNWQSPAQVLQVLRSRGHQIDSTHAAALATLDDPLAYALLEYRDAVIRAQTFGREWLEAHRHPLTGRIHAQYIQIGTPSGRMACIRPNVQNIPRSPAYRACIRAAEGHVLVKADFSQIELRIAAVIANDPAMLSAFQHRQDLHAVTAARVLNVPLDQVEKSQRQLAKALNFGLVYGMGARGLQTYAARHYHVALTAAQANRHRQTFFHTYRGLWRWQQHVARRLQQHANMETYTLVGRRQLNVRHLPVALNSPVQGTGADGLKLALARLFEYRHDVPWTRLVACVHDELVAECPADEAEQTAQWLAHHMTVAMAEILGNTVPVVIETSVGRDWTGGE
jgi:DNA polymerase-1